MPLQDSDNFIIGRGTDSYKITYEDLKDDLNYVPTPALEVGKGFISPSVNVTEGDTVTGSANVTGGVNPVVTHVFELDGVEVQRGTSAIYVTEGPGDLRYRVEASDDTFRISVIGEWSEAVNVEAAIDDTVPNATMHGLRFDPDRETRLQRDADLTGMTEFTISMWAKVTQNTSNRYAFSIPCKSNPIDGSSVQYSDNMGISARPQSGIWKWYGSNVSSFDIGPCTLNTWQHVVISCDGSTITGYVNGVKAAGSSSAGDWSSELIRVGNRLNENSGADIIFPGYISDVYFVEQALEATDFGAYFEGKWGPLDSSEVLENIGYKESPADTAPNYDQEWTTAVALATNPEQMFDGDLTNNGAETGLSASAYVNFEQHFGEIIVNNSLEFYGNSGDQVYIFNDDPATEESAGNGWYKTSFTGQLKRLEWKHGSGGKAFISGVRIDGRILIDGPADNSQVWSDNASGDINSSRPPANAFDGNPDTWANSAAPNEDGTTEVVFNFNPPISSGALEIYAAGDLRYTTTDYRGGLTVNSTDRTLAVLGEDPNNGSSVTIPKDWFAVTSADGGDISSVGVITARTESYSYDGISAYQFKANGKLLIDGAPEWDTSQIWSDGSYETWDPDYPLENIFDGNLTTFGYGRPPGGGGCTFTGLTANTSVRLYGFEANSGDWRITLGGVEYKVDFDTTGSPEWKTISAPYPVSVDSLTNNSSGRVYAIEVDGEILVDPGSIGENGFYLPFDPEAGKSWTNTIEAQNTNANSGLDPTSGLFDDERIQVGPGYKKVNEPIGTYIEVVFKDNEGPTIVSEGEIGFLSNYESGINHEGYVEFMSGDQSTLTFNGSAGSSDTLPFTGSGVIKKIRITRTAAPYNSAGHNTRITQVWADGVHLIDHSSIGADASGQGNHFADENFELTGSTQDTVLDTPMNNYAVLEDGKNGNLEQSLVAPTKAGAASTQTLTSGKYYWEVTGYHNGNDAGAVGVLRANLSSNTLFTDNPSGVYYYSFTGNKYIDGTDTAYGDAWKGVGTTYVIGVALDLDNDQIIFYKDGVAQPAIDLPDNTEGWKAHSNYGSVSDSFDITCNFGQQPFVYTSPEGYSGIYQTWVEYARTALGYALDRITKLEQLRLEDAETIANLRILIDGALSRISSIESDEINDDAVDNSLITLVGSLSSQITTWTQRIEQAESALSSVSDRVTTLEL